MRANAIIGFVHLFLVSVVATRDLSKDEERSLLLRALGRSALHKHQHSVALEHLHKALDMCGSDQCRARLLVEIVEAESQSPSPLSETEWCAMHDSLRAAAESLAIEAPRWSDPDASSLPLLEGVSGGGAAVYLALHRAAEECGRYEEAWRYQSRGLQLKMIEKSLSSTMLTSQNWLKHILPAVNIFMALKGFGSFGPSMNYPIFLVGMPRSVISLVNNILGNHDAIYNMPMEPALLMTALRGKAYHEEAISPVIKNADAILERIRVILTQSTPDEAKLEEIRSYLNDNAIELAKKSFGIHQFSHENPNKVFYVDLIAENTHLIGLIHLLYPSALIINCVMDPLDAFYIGLNDEVHSPVDAPWIHSRYHQSKYLAISANVVEMFREHLPPNRITDVSVSALLEDPRSVLEGAVLRPLGLAWQEGMERGGGAGPMLARLRRLRGRARKYMQNGDISVYQSSIDWHLQNVHLPAAGGQERVFPFPDSIDWHLGKQVRWSNTSCDDMNDIEIPKKRDDIGAFLDRLGMTTGAELGVQAGSFSETTLAGWKNCKKYYLIDAWRQLDSNYLDSANVNDNEQEKLYKETKQRLKKFEARTDLVYIRDLTSKAVHSIPDGSLDFVYIDARHDYCSVSEDLELYWPKLRPGGIMAGHDYMLGHALHEFIEGEFLDRFDLCPNGTVVNRSVKGAVDDFVKSKGLNIALTFNCFPPFLSFIFRKPCGRSISDSTKIEL